MYDTFTQHSNTPAEIAHIKCNLQLTTQQPPSFFSGGGRPDGFSSTTTTVMSSLSSLNFRFDRSRAFSSNFSAHLVTSLVVASTDGSTREATVGRAKVEPRPCVQVDLQPGGSVFLQQAETVRLAGPAGPLPVTRVQVGDEVLVRPDSMGTHVGQRISVPVDER